MVIDRKRYMLRYPTPTAVKHGEVDHDFDKIDVLYEDTDLHALCVSSDLTVRRLVEYFKSHPKVMLVLWT